MSNALRNVAESTASAISDLVDEARDRIEDLPSITLGRRKTSNRRWAVIVVAAVVGVIAMVACRRRCRDAGDDSGAGAHLAEKSLAVS